MNKSVYSIVLTDEVIRAVDERAYCLGTNRSNVINQILAEYFSCVTPEMRMRSILESALGVVGTNSFLTKLNSDSVLTMRSGLDYKYRPTISYRIELDRIPEHYLGKLKISIRTQNAEAAQLFDTFFRYIAPIEASLLAKRGFAEYRYGLTKNGFIRYFVDHKTNSEAGKGEAIAGYVRLLNQAVRMYFSAPEALPEIAIKYGTALDDFFNETLI